VPSDLGRMIPEGVDPFAWAETQLLASPGAVAMRDGKKFRIHTLVPAVKADGSCIHFENGLCAIHEVAPFGCAYFDCGPDPRYEASRDALIAIMREPPDGLYNRIWRFLSKHGLEQQGPEVLRQRMVKELEKKADQR